VKGVGEIVGKKVEVPLTNCFERNGGDDATSNPRPLP
jgi:hypothetical protein